MSDVAAKVHQGVEQPHKAMFALEFVREWWDEHKVSDHDGRVLVLLAKQYNVFRRPDAPDEYWALQGGLYKITLGGDTLAGNQAFCFKKLDEYRRDNPQGLSQDVLAIIDEFLKKKEATDGTKSVPSPDQGAA